MAGSVNKVIIIGNVGKDPEIRVMQSGDKIALFSVATSESWKDKATGERQERTQWHNIVVFNTGLINVVEAYVRKGTKLHVEGQLETRKWRDSQGNDRYTTEVVLRPYKGELTLLSSPREQSDGGAAFDNTPSGRNDGAQRNSWAQQSNDEYDDEIPF